MNIHQGNGEVAMSDTEYGAALKLGKKQYQDAVAKGEYPYLPGWMMFYPIRILYPQ